MNFKEAIPRTTIDSTEVASEDEGDMTSIEDIVCQEGTFPKSSPEEIRTQFRYHLKSPKHSVFVQLLSLPKTGQRKTMLYISRFFTGIQKAD